MNESHTLGMKAELDRAYQARYALYGQVNDLEQQLQKVNAHNDQLAKDLNIAQEEKEILLDANGKLYAESSKLASKVDLLYGAVTALSNLLSVTMDERLSK